MQNNKGLRVYGITVILVAAVIFMLFPKLVQNRYFLIIYIAVVTIGCFAVYQKSSKSTHDSK